jgi:predicted SnoaL-like aldol condensation-catalyzing enzyme
MMKLASLGVALVLVVPFVAHAQVEVKASPDHERLLASRDPHLAANKRLVYDFWRTVLEAGHLDQASTYLAEDYVQHNPNVPTGRAGFIEFFSKFAKARPVEAKVRSPLVAITAEGDLVVLSFVHRDRDPADSTRTYTTTSFDMFRVQGKKIVEHWDADRKE